MIESPLLQELVAASRHKDIVAFLEARFGEVPEDLAKKIKAVIDEDKLTKIVRAAAASDDLPTFRKAVR